MIKILGTVILVGAALLFLNKEKVEDYKQRITESINPSAKEKRIIGELESNLDVLANILNKSPIELGKMSADEKQKFNTSLTNARITLQELKESNQKTDLAGNLSNLIQKVLPFDIKPSPTWLPPQQECEQIPST
ncbi:MAG: hypothetical protein Q8R55_07350 [Candidatus Taylorbacteria bacterium]|nr:hypothetical protein [Candidatus Taylorbacteria bacterium]